MTRLFTILITGASLALVSCASPKKECATCDSSKAKSDCCAKGAAPKSDCASCDSHAKKKK